jgi:serine/threonine-protein kinase
LASGSTGEIYEATHPSQGGRYAVKVLRSGLAQAPEAVQTFLAELASISSLRHPNVVQVFNCGTLPQDGRPFVVMERLDGRTLEARIGDGRPLPAVEVARIIKGVASALQSAHTNGVVHRELHPGHIFMAVSDGDGPGIPKVLNFGIARLRNASGGDTGVGAEEARYMAPEQAQGRSEEIDGRTDEFALAAIAYRLLCAADAFRGADPIAVLYQVVHEPPAPMANYTAVDPRVEAVVLRGLSKRQSDRWDTVQEFARALDDAVEGRDAPSAPRRQGPRDTLIIDESRRRSFTPGAAALALPGGGVLRDEPWIADSDDFDDELDRPPNHRWRLAGFLVAFLVICTAAALWAGWRPPLMWRQSPAWHALHLPRAAEPTFAPPPTSPAPASPPPATGEPSPAPSAPAIAGAGNNPPATQVPAPNTAPAATSAAPGTTNAPATAAPAMPGPPPSPHPVIVPQASAPAAASPADRPAAASQPRAHHHHEPRENMSLRGMVWSDKEQRLVPAGDTPPPAFNPPPSAARPNVAPGSPDAPLPLSH